MDEQIKLPWQTSDSALALALHCAGFIPQTVSNNYDERTLKRLGCKTVKKAIESNRAGMVVYSFERTPEIEELAAVYADQMERSKKQQPIMIETNAAEIVRIAACIQNLRKEFAKLWTLPALFWQAQGTPEKALETSIDQNGKPAPIGGHLRHPGFKVASVNLSEDKRKELGI